MKKFALLVDTATIAKMRHKISFKRRAKTLQGNLIDFHNFLVFIYYCND